MDRRNLASLGSDQLVTEIRRAREELEDTARYMAAASIHLHAKVRRSDFREAASRTASVPEGAPREVADRLRQEAISDVSSVYILYSNTWQRFAGMVLQGVRRTTTSERIMRKMEEKRGVLEEAPPPPPKKRVLSSEDQPAMEDLVNLYGIETVTHAQR